MKAKSDLVSLHQRYSLSYTNKTLISMSFRLSFSSKIHESLKLPVFQTSKSQKSPLHFLSNKTSKTQSETSNPTFKEMKMKQLHSFSLCLIILSLHQTTSSAIAHYFPNISSLPPPSQLPNITTDSVWAKFNILTNSHLNDSVLGLSNLKSYLFHFGYITNSSAETFTDDFDSDLESALKSYQLNFNLNATGILDEPTLRQIQRPRCGSADVINGTSTMKKNTSTTTNHFSTVAHYSFFPNSPRWPEDQRDLTYAFLPANQLEESAKEIFARAFASWAAVIPVTFTRIETYTAADIRIGFFTTDHGDGEPFDGVLGVLAHAFSPPHGMFHLDGDEYWVDGATAADPSAFDLESVAVHEIGHLLGLGHSSVEEAIMYPSISGGMRKVELAADDVEGVQVLYGSKTTTSIGSTPATQQGETNEGGRVTRGAHLMELCLLLAVGCWMAS